MSGFLAFVMNHRGKGTTKILLGSDGGQGSLKITCNLVEEEGATRSGRYLDSSVKRAFILFFGEEIPETYFNIATIRMELKLNTIENLIETNDLKMDNHICGMQGGSSTYPCVYCLAKRILKNGVIEWEKGRLRTLGMLKQHAAAFAKHLEKVRAKNPHLTEEKQLKKAKTDAKDFFNVINPPLLNGSDNDLVLLLLPPPEFHIFEGCVNKIVTVLNDVWSQLASVEDRFFIWLEKNQIYRLKYKGEGLNGPACSKLLEKLTLLEDDPEFPQTLKPFTFALHAYNRVRYSCFSNQLIEGYGDRIKEFKRSLNHLRDAKGKPINIINKMHILFEHVEDFCILTNRGLGYYSEQAKEAIHHDFKSTQSLYTTKQDKASYGDRMTGAVVKYNSKNL